MPAYESTGFDPPAPMARVELRDSEAVVLALNVGLLIDTGADVTLLPRAALGTITIDGPIYELIGFDGNRSVATAVTLEMIFLGRRFKGQYLLIDQEVGILGRDVLNHVVLELDGPAGRWDERANL